MPDNRFMKRLYKPNDFYRLLSDLMSSAGASKGLHEKDRVSKQFMERIMLAVTEVNGCRYCSYFHTQVSLKAGLKKEEISRTLEGDFKDAPQIELAALYFTQHYAESRGKPNPEAAQCLLDAYGLKKSRAIVAYIRAIMIGNAWGNMFDALRSRIKGSPMAGFSFCDEMGVIIGPVIFIPLIAINRLFKKQEINETKIFSKPNVGVSEDI
jgi:AhpD family alkylhydroperoxidase